MERSFRTARIAIFWFCATAILTCAQNALAQEESDAPESKFVDVGDVRLQYLDFGGEGLPILFIHTLYRGASTWTDFAPRFTDRNRVLAITARGVSPSGGEWAPVATRVQDILALMDTLGIRRAVFIGNSSPARDMTYLAEHYPSRVAGLVYLANAPLVDTVLQADPTSAFEMYLRGHPYPHHSYRPEYLRSPGSKINVPALTFVSSTGTRGMENQSKLLLKVAGQVTEGKFPDSVPEGKEDWFEDSEARAFFERLADDESLQQRVQTAWEEQVVPAFLENEKAFKRAFGDDLRVVQLDVPFVTGYAYMNAPERIVQPIRDFLNEVRARERSR